MQDSRSLGRQGEIMAVRYLQEKGYKLLATNFRTRMGEIDVIVQDGQTLVFVEVKTRRSIRYGWPSEAVTRRKQHKIIVMAYLYLNSLHKNCYEIPIRFDVVEIIVPHGKEALIRHISHAFTA